MIAQRLGKVAETKKACMKEKKALFAVVCTIHTTLNKDL
jgi:hypothetical protein